MKNERKLYLFYVLKVEQQAIPDSLKDFDGSEEIWFDYVCVWPVIDQVDLAEVHGERSRDHVLAVGHYLQQSNYYTTDLYG